MKIKLSILLFLCALPFFSQTKIGSVDLALKKSSDFHQLYSTIDNFNDKFYVLAADKEVTTLIKYNKALFFSDSLKTKTDKNYPLIIGNSFNHKNDFVAYWASKDYKKFMSQTYDFNNHKTDTILFEIPFKDELLLSSFKHKNLFYFLSYVKKEEQLKLYTLQGNKYNEKTLDFKSFKLGLNQSRPISIAKYIATNPIEVIDNESFNPLYAATNKVKLYAIKNKLLITLDYSSAQTHVFEIDLSSYEVKEKVFPKTAINSEEYDSNSFYHQENLYQLKANKNQLMISRHDYNEIESVQEYSVLAEEKIQFKNSPLYIQNGNSQPREIKNTEKFLKRLKNKSLGISVYQTEGDLLITVGGTNTTITSDGIVLGTLLTIGGIMIGDYGTFPDMTSSEIMQNVYFECRFDRKFKPKSTPFGPLAIDYISGFLQDNTTLKLQNTTKHKSYFILSYYDASAKQIILRKFEDGYPLISDF
jgi:hypothetical protein